MYDDLARSQRPSLLEQFVVQCVIPSVLATFVMQCRALTGAEETFIGSDAMRPASSVASVTVHVALGAAVLLGQAKSSRSSPTPTRQVSIIFPQTVSTGRESGIGVPAPRIPSIPDVPIISLPETVLQSATPSHPIFPVYAPSNATSGSGQPAGGIAPLGEAGPEVLTGPLPVYPELLRRAGVQGQVVLEALVDTTGRVQATSISVVAATNPGFVAPARQALLATLFRPARVGGRPVRMLVRVPFDFTIRGGTGRAR